MTALGEELIDIASQILQRIGDDIADEIEDITLRESTRFWHRGADDYVELMTIEIGDGAHWYVMRMDHAWDVCEVAQQRGGEDIHVQDYVDVFEALRALVARELALRISEIL